MVQHEFARAILARCMVVMIATTLPAGTRKPAETCSVSFTVQGARTFTDVRGMGRFDGLALRHVHRAELSCPGCMPATLRF